MGYKVNESDLANNWNYRLAMYKGEPVQLLAVQQNAGAHRYDVRYEYKLYARKIGNEGQKFKIDPTEPTLSADACQGGYCLDSGGKELAFLNIVNGSIKVAWCTTGWSTPEPTSKEMYKCVTGDTPTFQKAHDELTKLIGRKKAYPFDRDFALVRDTGFTDISVHYRGHSIGTYDPKTKRINLRKGPTVKLLKRKLDRLTKEQSNE